MAWGRKRALRLSGSSVRPAYPGFMVMKAAQVFTSLISLPSNMNLESCNQNPYRLYFQYTKYFINSLSLLPCHQSSLVCAKWLTFDALAFLIVMSCCAMTESTSMSILLNSSKQHQAPDCAKPEKKRPIIWKIHRNILYSQPSLIQTSVICTPSLICTFN